MRCRGPDRMPAPLLLHGNSFGNQAVTAFLVLFDAQEFMPRQQGSPLGLGLLAVTSFGPRSCAGLCARGAVTPKL